MTAVIHKHFRSLVLRANARELFGLRMRFAEVHAQAALSVVNLLHVSPPLKKLGAVMPQVLHNQIGMGLQSRLSRTTPGSVTALVQPG